MSTLGFGLREVRFAHRHGGRGAFIGGDGIVQVELAGGILLVERADALQVAFGLLGQGPVLVQLSPGLVDAGLVDLGVDDEKGLSAADVGTLFEEHPFEEALHPGTDLDELLGTDAADVFAVDFDVVRPDGFDLHDGIDGFRRLRAEEPPDSSGYQDGANTQNAPGPFGKTADTSSGFLAKLKGTAPGTSCLPDDFLA